MARRHQFRGRAFDVRNFRIGEKRPVEDGAAAVDHPDQQASGISRQPVEAGDEGVMLGGENGAVGLLYEFQHLDEVVEVIIDGQCRQADHAGFSRQDSNVLLLFE